MRQLLFRNRTTAELFAQVTIMIASSVFLALMLASTSMGNYIEIVDWWNNLNHSNFLLGALVLPRLPVAVLLMKDDWPSVDPKIVGGTVASEGEFPYQVSLQKLSPSGYWSHNCGGSIYSEKAVITAAHCINGFENYFPFYSYYITW